MKRLLAILGIVCAVSLMLTAVHDFDKAHTGIQLFKALFWMAIAGVALISFLEDYRENKWPF